MSDATTPMPALLESAPQPRSSPLRPWMLILVAALAMAVYANSMRNGFAFDDVAIVQTNKHVLDLEWTTIWTDNYWPNSNGFMPDALYRPLTLWSYLANQALTPDLAWPFHLTNVLLHALVTVLTSVLAWRVLGNARIALVTGLLFAVHPVHTEVVANTVGRAELLAALWSLLALLVFLPVTPLTAHAPLARRGWWHGLLVAACFLAAMLSKETPATLIFLFPCIDLWRWLRQPQAERPRWWRWMGGQTLRYYLPQALALGFYLVLRMRACGLMMNTSAIHPIVNLLVQATPLERLVTPFMLLGKHLWLMLWPVHLSADYSSPSLVPTSNLFFGNAFQPPPALGLLVCVLALLGAVMRWRKSPQLALLLVCFASSYALVANFLRIGTIFGERLFYWPSVFFLILLSWALVAGFEKMQHRLPARRQLAFAGLALLLLAAPVTLMGLRTWERNTDWTSNLTLAISTARDNPSSGKACSWAGSILVLNEKPEVQDFAKTLIQRAIDLSPNLSDARWNMAKYYGVRHDLGNSAVYIAQGCRLDPGSHLACAAVPALLDDMRKESPEKYMPAIEANLRDHPDAPEAHLALAYGYHAQGKLDEAAAETRKAIDMAHHVRADGFDQFHEAGAELANIWRDQGRLKDAVDKYRIYATFMSHSVDAQCAYATMLMKLAAEDHPEALQEAYQHLIVATALDPGDWKIRGLIGQVNGLERQHLREVAADSANAPRSLSGASP